MSGISSIGFGSNAIQNALSGINRGIAGVNQDAAIVASNGLNAGGIGDAVTNALIDAQQQLLSVEASAKALSITDQTLGTLIDVKA
jgi:hypothetical protein